MTHILALEVFKLPKPVQTNQNQNRNLNSPQNQVSSMQAGGKYCYKCQGEDWDACTQDKNKVLCGHDQGVCFVEMRSQQGKPVSKANLFLHQTDSIETSENAKRN